MIQTPWTATFKMHEANGGNTSYINVGLFSTENNAKSFILRLLMDQVHRCDINNIDKSLNGVMRYFHIEHSNGDCFLPRFDVLKCHEENIPLQAIWECVKHLFKGVNRAYTIEYEIKAPVMVEVDTEAGYTEFYTPSTEIQTKQ